MTKSVFAYRNGVLCAEALPFVEIVDEIDAPFYCTSVKQIKRNVRAFLAPFDKLKVNINYTVRTNGTLAVLRALNEVGAGFDVSCAGELARALEADIHPSCLMLSGQGKTQDDIIASLLAGVAHINVGSLDEISLIEPIARTLNDKAPVVLRLDVCGAGGGFSPSQMAEVMGRVLSSQFLDFKGLALPCEELTDSFDQQGILLGSLASYVRLIQAQGIKIEYVGLGAGPSFLVTDGKEKLTTLYARLVHEELGDFEGTLFFEPGQSLVHDARVLVARVLQIKNRGEEKDILVDMDRGEMTCADLMEKKCEIIPVRENQNLKMGDLLVIMGTGVFGQTIASPLGSRSLTPEVMVSGAQYAVVRRRVAVVEQIAWESCPDWMGGECVAQN